jgi:hypothetical protein
VSATSSDRRKAPNHPIVRSAIAHAPEAVVERTDERRELLVDDGVDGDGFPREFDGVVGRVGDGFRRKYDGGVEGQCLGALGLSFVWRGCAGGFLKV